MLHRVPCDERKGYSMRNTMLVTLLNGRTFLAEKVEFSGDYVTITRHNGGLIEEYSIAELFKIERIIR